MSTTMIITIVPPIGPPIPILVGRAIRSLPNSTLDVFLKPEFEKAKKLSWKQNLTRVSKHFGVGYYTTSQILTVHLFTNFILWQLSIGSSFNLGHRQTHRLWARATELLYNCFTLFIRTVTSTLSLWGKKIGIKVFQKMCKNYKPTCSRSQRYQHSRKTHSPKCKISHIGVLTIFGVLRYCYFVLSNKLDINK